MRFTLGRQGQFKPRSPRHAVVLEANLVLENGLVVPILIRDLSDEGFMAECHAYAEIGSQVEVALTAHNLVRSQIRWALPGRIGVTFREPIHERLVPETIAQDDPPARAAR